MHGNQTIDSPLSYARRSGASAIAAGSLMLGGVAGEWIVSAQEPDGVVTNRLLFALYVGLFTAGAAFLVRALRGLRGLHVASGEKLSRSGRAGIRLSIAGAGLLSLFGATVAATGVATGVPLEASFVFFGLGLLLLVFGQTALSFGLQRAGVIRSWWLAPLAGAFGALVAVAVPLDPGHDLGFLVFTLGWITLGVHLVHRARLAGELPVGAYNG